MATGDVEKKVVVDLSKSNAKSVQKNPRIAVITTVDPFTYAGRPVQLSGPMGIFTIQFTDYRGGFSWFDPETHHVWHREEGAENSLQYACSFYRICKREGSCSGSPDGVAPHNHGEYGVPLYFLKQIRLEFVVRNYYALSRETPPLEQFRLVYGFYHDRIHGSSAKVTQFTKVPKWVLSSAQLGFPYTCEARRASGRLCGIMQCPIRHLIAIIEANAVFEEERFGMMDPYLECALPMDYKGPEMLKPLVPSILYVRRWRIPSKQDVGCYFS